MLLKVNDGQWPMLLASWGATWDPSHKDETRIVYIWGVGNAIGYLVKVPASQDTFVKFLEENYDEDTGIVDITPLQG